MTTRRNFLLGCSAAVVAPSIPPMVLAPLAPLAISLKVDDYASTMLRAVASSMDIPHAQLSQDWSVVHYSSARTALLEAFRREPGERRRLWSE